LPEHAGQTLAAFLRKQLPGRSWNDVRRLIETRHVRVGGELCLDPVRRVNEGEAIEVAAESAPKPKPVEDKVIRYLDQHIVVAEKPAGINTVRHPSERDWPLERRQQSPTLEDILPPLIVQREGRVRKGPPPRLRVVQRLDKETSGLVVFARTPAAQRLLAKQFGEHSVVRRYLAVVPGFVEPQRVATRFVRDRGDGRRGSGKGPASKEAITHVAVEERLNDYTLLSCRLETGRTHQIRIHLAELGHPVCGDRVYIHQPDGTVIRDASKAPRLALHATELGFEHPITKEQMFWTMPLPADLQRFVERVRGMKPAPAVTKSKDGAGKKERRKPRRDKRKEKESGG
jgi:23S rRNA pseudouridine1911/1915/1917 synthase